MAIIFTNCQIANMADAAAARREARRRKILENSQNRLQRISGKCEGELYKESTSRPILPENIYEATAPSDSTTSFRSSISLNNGIVVTEPPSVAAAPSSHTYGLEAAGDGLQLANDISSFMSSVQEPTSTSHSTVWSKLVSYKYDVVIVSILVQLLCNLSLLTFDETHFFLPLLVYVVTKIIWFPTPSSPNFMNALLLMNGISVDRVEKIISVVQWVTMLSQDVCVYLFTTICMQVVYKTMKDWLVT